MRSGFYRAARCCAALAVAAALMLPAGTRSAAAEEWECYIYNPVATVAAVRGLNRVIEAVGKETNGALTIRLHLGGSLQINTTNITQAVADGVVQMGDDGYMTGNIPIVGILRLPMLVRTQAEFDKAMAIMEPYIAKAYEKKGVVVLGQYYYPMQVGFSRKKLTMLADIKGQKLRVTSPEQGEFVKRFGGVSLTLGAPEVPSALDRGVIDGVYTASSGGGVTWKDLLKYNYRLGLHYFNSVVIANKGAFDKLTPEVQATVRKVVRENLPWSTQTMEQEEVELTNKFAAEGMVVTPAKPEDVAEAEKVMAPYWGEWAQARGPEAVEALQKVRAMLGR